MKFSARSFCTQSMPFQFHASHADITAVGVKLRLYQRLRNAFTCYALLGGVKIGRSDSGLKSGHTTTARMSGVKPITPA